ncbi:hypothetical protein VMCG_07998 [Cytospora schulzeri]|uniref:Uncharacterized protein n=1 Tax=Cytospora schulzeri TaxID=448051 RepID=A0A423VYD9_9PEZI|nr:hypothetical protein VMCG_07998 [Valsa malicola]
MGQCHGSANKKAADALLAAAPKKPTGLAVPEPDLNKALLNSALSVVADQLIAQKKNITVVVVGGAVNTILGNRASTHDVDFFNAKLAPKELTALDAAAKKACSIVTVKPPLQEGWFNNRTIVFIPTALRVPLTDEAIAQNDVLFAKKSPDKKAGLTVFAAPWHYAFCCKVDRFAGSGLIQGQAYDVQDAVFYIQKHMAKKGVKEVKMAEIKVWFTRFRLKWNPSVEIVLNQIKAANVPIV